MAKSKTYEMLLKIAGKTDGSLKAACSAAEKDLNTLGDAAKKVGKVAATALAGIATAAAGVAASSLSAYSEFEQAMDSTAVTARATEEEYALMEAAARQMGATTTKTATDAAEAMGYMALAGWDVEQSMAGLEPMLRLSEATGMDLARASDLATDSMSALGLGVEDMTDYLDLAVQAQRASNTTAEALMEAYIGCGGAARTAGVDMGDLSTALGVLANNGTKGAEAGTAMNAMINRLTSKNVAIKAMQQMGVSVYDAAGEFRGLETILTDVSSAMADMTTQEKMGYLAKIAGTNYATEMSYLLAATSKDAAAAEEFLRAAGLEGDALAEALANTSSVWSTLETDIMDHSGVLLEVAKANTDNLAGATAIFQSAVAELQLQIGEQLAPYAKEGLEYLANNVLPTVAQKAGEIIPMVIEGGKALWENRNTILAVAGAVGTAVGAFKGLKVASAAVGAVKNLSTILGAGAKNGNLLAKVLGMGNVKLALIAAVIAAVAAGFVLLWNKSEKFRETVMVLWGQLQALGGALADMAGAIWAKAAPLLEMLGNALLNGLERAVDLLAPVAGNILGIFTGIADFITGVFTGDWDKALQGLQNIFGNALSGLGNLAVAGFTAILEIGTSIWPAIDNAVQAGIAAISSRFPVLGAVLGSLWSTVQKVWSNIQVILQNAIQFVQNVFAGNWSGAWQNIVNIFGAIFGTVASIAMAPMNMLANGVQAAINSVAAFLSEKFPFLGALFSGWAASISAAIENIKAIFSGIIDFVQNVFSGNWSAAWQNIVDIFGNLFGMIVNLAKAPINGVISAINFVLEKINGISVTIPDWVPGVGGTTLGFNIPTIPQLATGGIVTAPTILEAGEGGEAEAILPLSKLAAMLQSVANAPEIPDLGNREDGPEEAPLAQLAKMLDDWNKNKKPDPHGPGQGGGGGWDLPDPPRPGGNDAPPPAGGQNPPGGGVDTITFAPVFNFYGGVTKEEAVEAGKVSFAEFKRLYKQLKAEERRKNLSASTR
ncbi:phage tail tape measure protein [Oscillospiraceae bacterium 50-60]